MRGGIEKERRLVVAIMSFSTSRFSTTAMNPNPTAVDLAQRKRHLRSKLRADLRAFDSDQRRHEDMAIQNSVLESTWFKSATSLCAYISSHSLREVETSKILTEVLSSSTSDDDEITKKKLYVPRVEDKNSNMRMLHISTVKDMVANSMNILEPSPLDASGAQREDVMLASDPVDMVLLPGVAFDRSGRRLGRGGGYYDVFLKKYQELATQKEWKQPLLVALSYSLQILDDNVIPVTSTDVPVDAIVSPSGVIRISPAALERM